MCLPSAFTKTQGLLEDEVSRVKVTLVSGGSRCFISCFGSSQPRGATPHPRSGQKPGGLHARGVAAGRSYPTSEVRGGSWECQAATAQEQPRELPQPEARGGGQEELSHVRGQGWQLRVPGWDSPGAASREVLPHAQDQGRWPRGTISLSRSGDCAGAGGPRGATPRSRSEGAVVRRYPSSKVRSSGCTLLEQP